MEGYRALDFGDAHELQNFLQKQNFIDADRVLNLQDGPSLPIVLYRGENGNEDDSQHVQTFRESSEYAAFLQRREAIICLFQVDAEENDPTLVQSSEWILCTLLGSKMLKTFMADFGGGDLSVESCGLFGKLLQTSTTLESLSLRGMAMNGDGLGSITRGLLSNLGSVLRTLEVEATTKLGAKGAEMTVEILRREIPALRFIRIWGPDFTKEETAQVARAVASNTTIESLSIGSRYDTKSFDKEGPVSQFLTALTPAAKRSVADEAIDQHNSSILDFSIDYGRGKNLAESVAKMLQGNTSVTKLGLRHAHFTCKEWKLVFDSLRTNEHVENLDLSGAAGLNHDQAFESLLELLEAKLTIKHVEMRYTPLEAEGRSNQVKEVLARNERVSTYLNALNRSVGLIRPSCGRVFVCGFPHSGKTTLSRSMVAGRKKSRRPSCWHNNRSKPRTHSGGIEVLELGKSGDGHITVWDMAGEDDYRALQNCHYLFPAINQCCIYLFVYQPYDKDGGGEQRLSDSNTTLTRLGLELRHWLNFVNSNSRKSRSILPQVSIVLTHCDKVMEEGSFLNAERYVAWASKTVDSLREAFRGRVKVHDDIHAVDAHNAQTVTTHVKKCFHQLFTTLPQVPAVAEQVNLVLSKRGAKRSNEPVMEPEKFLKHCSESVPELRPLFQKASGSTLDEFKLALQSYLHDVGVIINMPLLEGLKYIVADRHWFCRVFLGELFQPGVLSWTKDGIVPKHVLENNLDDFISKRRLKGLGSQHLVGLMEELELCHKITRGSSTSTDFFIPRAIPDHLPQAQHGRRELHWTVQQAKPLPTYRGFRLQSVGQSHNFLSTGVFQRYQFLTHQRIACDIEKNLVRIKDHGMEMLVESSGVGEHYVDILIRSYGSDTTDMQKLYESVLQEFRSICESRRECAGIRLEEAILRPACVESLTLCIHRKHQAVSKERLKDDLVKKLLDLPSEDRVTSAGGANVIPENFLEERNHSHPFPAVPQANLLEEWVKATDMLTIVDIKETTFKYRQSVKEQTDAIYQAADEVLAIGHRGDQNSASSSTAIERKTLHRDPDAPPNDDMKLHLDAMEKRLHDDLEKQFRRLENKMQTIGGLILEKLEENKQLLKELVQNSVNNVQMVHGKRQTVLIEKLEQVMCSAQGAHGIPRFPYFTDSDADLSQQLMALSELGKPYKLHFMCEAPSEVHAVKGQEGYPVVHLWERRVYQRLRPIVSASIKVFFILVKVGLHIGAGIGSAIEGFTSSAGAVPLTTFSSAGEAIINEVTGTTYHETVEDLADGWRCVQEVMGPVVSQGAIPKYFKLFPVKYTSEYLEQTGVPQRVYWVCGDCWKRAKNAQLLDKNYNSLDSTHTPWRILHKEDITFN